MEFTKEDGKAKTYAEVFRELNVALYEKGIAMWTAIAAGGTRFDENRAEFACPLGNSEYWNIFPDNKYDADFPDDFRHIAVYAVPGSIEGYYVHADGIRNDWARKDKKPTTETVFLGKFWDFEQAAEFAKQVALIINGR